MKHRYMAPAGWPLEAQLVVDEMNALLDAADDAGAGEATMLRRRAEAMGKRLDARMASVAAAAHSSFVAS